MGNDRKANNDLSRNLESFYSEKRGDDTNVFSVIDSSKLSEKKEDGNMDRLDSFYIPEDDAETKKIFDDVITYKNKAVQKNNQNRMNDNITEEILAIDLPNDDVFVRDVIDSYEESFKMPKSQKDRKLLTLTNELDDPKNFQSPTRNYTEFVSTKRIDNDYDDERFNSFKASLDSAYANQDEIHKSIQIALDDVKKHRDIDLVQSQPTSAAPSESIHIAAPTTETEAPTPNEFMSESGTYAINFKSKDDDFSFVDNTNSARRFSDHLTSLQTVVPDAAGRETAQPAQTTFVSEDRVKELVQAELAKMQQTRMVQPQIDLYEQQSKAYEARTKMIEQAREEINSERQRMLEAAEQEREKLMNSARSEIELERERLRQEQEQYEQLKNELESRIQENKEFVENQRLILLEAAQKERQRVLNETKARKESSTADVLNEIKNALDDLRGQRNAAAAQTKPIAEPEPEQETNKYKKLFSDLSVKLDDIQKDLTVAISQDEFADHDMQPASENRSYTEKIIDDIEQDDQGGEEAIPIPTIPLEFTRPIQMAPRQPREEAKTSELTDDVDVMRRALKNVSGNRDFDFDEKRQAYQNEKMKEEIKREILEEMALMTKDAVALNTTIPAFDPNDNATASIQTTEIAKQPSSNVTLHSSDKVPELVKKTPGSGSTRTYDFDFLTDLSPDPFSIPVPASRTGKFPVDVTSDPLSPQLFAPDFSMFGGPSAPAADRHPTANPFANRFETQKDDKPKTELRRARLTFNKKRQDNLSSSELIKSIAKEIRSKSNLKK